MSKAKNFVSRWSRLKHAAGGAAPPEAYASAPEVVDRPLPDQPGARDAEPGTETSEATTFDVASLPPIESIVAGGDIRPFLQPGVPAHVTRAALRTAWAADPAIRDFIGIAENQWDFNEAAGIPGFGAVSVIDAARGFAAAAPGPAGGVAMAIASMSGLAAPSISEVIHLPSDGIVDKVWRISAQQIDHPAQAGMASRGEEKRGMDVAARSDPVAETVRPQGGRRSHGSALPK